MEGSFVVRMMVPRDEPGAGSEKGKQGWANMFDSFFILQF